jgi:hypothetical protein
MPSGIRVSGPLGALSQPQLSEEQLEDREATCKATQSLSD